MLIHETEGKALAAAGPIEAGWLVERNLARLVIDLDDVAPEEVGSDDAVQRAPRVAFERSQRQRGDVELLEPGVPDGERHGGDAVIGDRASRPVRAPLAAEREPELSSHDRIDTRSLRARVEDE